jgi:hypothetical protein
MRLGLSYAAGIDGGASLREPGIAQNLTPSLGCCQGDLGALGNYRTLLLG